MTQEEAQGFLHALEAGLAEFGATELARKIHRGLADVA